MSKKEIAIANEVATDVAVVASAIDFGADAGAGMEGADDQSFAIPFLTALQKISPQCDEAEAKYIEGAKGGMLCNSVTSQLFDGKTGCIFLPTSYQRRFLHWGPRGESNSGFKGDLTPEKVAQMRADGSIVEQDGQLYFPLPDGSINDKKCDRLSDTRNHFGILVDEATGAYSQVLLSLGSTQIKKSKLLMSLLSAVKVKNGAGALVTPPTWANKVRITTVLESNDKGSWYGYKFELDGFVASAEQYAAGKSFHDTISSGQAGPVQYVEPEVASDKF